MKCQQSIWNACDILFIELKCTELNVTGNSMHFTQVALHLICNTTPIV